jgi:nucleotide-binding universal stress UspA family protein
MTAEPTTDGFTRILVATDFSPTSEGAWLVARRLAARLGVEIVILHVLVEAPLFSEGPFTMKHARSVFEAARAWVEKALGEWVATATTAGVPARWTVRTGVPYKEIVAAAESERPDLIGMGYARTGRARPRTARQRRREGDPAGAVSGVDSARDRITV